MDSKGGKLELRRIGNAGRDGLRNDLRPGQSLVRRAIQTEMAETEMAALLFQRDVELLAEQKMRRNVLVDGAVFRQLVN